MSAQILPFPGLQLCACNRGAANVPAAHAYVCEFCADEVQRQSVTVLTFCVPMEQPMLAEVLASLAEDRT